MNGIELNGISIMQDADETFARDFLLATQTCNMQEFRLPGQNYKSSKILSKTLVFESSLSCIWKDRTRH